MLTAIHSRFGNPADVLEVREADLPEPAAGQIRVKMVMASIHNHDLLTVSGDYGYKPELPASAGTEAMGVVDALGDGVTHLKVGQRVAVSGAGTWAEYYLAAAAMAVPLPDGISDEEGAQLISMPLSALVLLDFAGVERGGWIVQNAANGAVGKALALFAKPRGINVINLVRREEAVSELQALGIDHAVSTSEDGWREKVATLTGGARIGAAIDGVGGSSAGDLLSLLGEKGLLVSFGLMSGRPLELSASDLIFKEAVVKGFWLSKIAPRLGPEKLMALIGEIIQGVTAGEIKLTVSEVFALADIKQAVAAAGESARKGKVLLRA
ncbi:MAG: zinc-binding dehydrogenase [Pseudorhizobium pelagicum]|uniref:zinc-binding dehydrogenase n=1 Tax=Pseudorhizobium pelagicum TaxID=1509405 RepID=UPI00345FDAEF